MTAAIEAAREGLAAQDAKASDGLLLALDTLADAPPPVGAEAEKAFDAAIVAMRKARQTAAASTQAADQMAQRIEHIEAAFDAAEAAAGSPEHDSGTAGSRRLALDAVASRLITGLAEDLDEHRRSIEAALQEIGAAHRSLVDDLSTDAVPPVLAALRTDLREPLAAALSPLSRLLQRGLASPERFDAVSHAAADGMEQVVAPLQATGAALEDIAARLQPDAAVDPAEPAVSAALEALAACYTMDRERQLHDRAVATLAAPPETASSTNETADTPARKGLIERCVAGLEDDPRTGFAATIGIGSLMALVTAIVLGFVPFKALLTALGVQAAVAIIAGLQLHFRAERRLETQREDTERMVFQDALTSTLNRRGMMRLLDGLLGTGTGPEKGRGSRPAEAVAALHVDLDHFKSVNDTLGHEAGDQVLEVASRRMEEAIGSAGTVCRVGGDEFCAILWEGAAAEPEATRIAGSIVESAKAPIDTAAGRAQIGASIGIAFWAAGAKPSPGRLLADADLATYVAKSEGRGRFALFDDRLRAAAEREAQISRALSKALAEGDGSTALQIWLQPVVDATDGRVIAAEALFRWFDAELGEIAPEAALTAAERSNLLDAVEGLVIDRTAAAAALLQERDVAPRQITINVDGVGLRRQGLADRLRLAAERHDVALTRFGIEVAESACAGRGADLAMGTLDQVRRSGIGLVIDRLGRDQVSLAGLSSIKAREAKLDRGLVGQIGQDGDGRSLLHGLVTMSRSLDLSITASGVETREQLAVLRQLGVDAMQGFAIARPMPPDAFAEWLSFGQEVASAG
ncbi:MAG: EAL domain-containing protein [Pseudomonadota bacterium]